MTSVNTCQIFDDVNKYMWDIIIKTPVNTCWIFNDVSKYVLET